MVVLLYLFIDKYKKSKNKELRSFAKGLEKDLDAVENAVAYDYSNGFVEGTNSRLKMIKRTMWITGSKTALYEEREKRIIAEEPQNPVRWLKALRYNQV